MRKNHSLKNLLITKIKHCNSKVRHLSTERYFMLLTACLLMFILSVKFISLHSLLFDRILGNSVLILSILMLVYFVTVYTLL